MVEDGDNRSQTAKARSNGSRKQGEQERKTTKSRSSLYKFVRFRHRTQVDLLVASDWLVLLILVFFFVLVCYEWWNVESWLCHRTETIKPLLYGFLLVRFCVLHSALMGIYALCTKSCIYGALTNWCAFFRKCEYITCVHVEVRTFEWIQDFSGDVLWVEVQAIPVPSRR